MEQDNEDLHSRSRKTEGAVREIATALKVLYIAHSITENIRTKADKILSMER